MDPTTYVKGVLRTECPYGPVLDRLRRYPLLMFSLYQGLALGTRVGRDQDVTKKGIFYGKGPLFDAAVVSDANPSQTIEDALIKFESDPRLIRLVHAYIGMMTEAGELQEQIYGVLFEGKELDVVNCQEEGGDGLWYHGVHSDAIGMPLEDMMTQNNVKLRTRFPEKFTTQEADVRDLDAERKTLEGFTSQSIKTDIVSAGQLVIEDCEYKPYSTVQVENL